MVQIFGTTTKQGAGARGPMLAALALMVLCAACSPIIRQHGYVPADQELALVTVGKDTRESVATAIGRPSASGLLNDDGWYYVQSTWKNLGPYAPKEEQREVVAISFDKDGVVSNIERFGLEQGRIVQLSRRVTGDSLQSKGFLAQMFGNIGGIGAGQLFKN
ncbi:outer membrane protein assembly factor BamE [Cypionkella sp.]|jgi:outer membrane protein assembly factor BamE (lipoprotein component of BamABCDE complex)|uniref:outer membrane protein assembly factor BamE n=1 Tax=Cypionkella sp. TaxID=2811411 RepID=UPI003752F404